MLGGRRCARVKRNLSSLAIGSEPLFAEARLVATLQHTNIVQVYDVEVDGPTVFIAMEFLHGQDVRHALKRAWTAGDGDSPPPTERMPLETTPVESTSTVPKLVDDPQPAKLTVDTSPLAGSRYPDGIGTALVIGGGAAATASVTLYVLARRAASSTFDAGPLEDYESQRSRATTMQTASWISASVGVALVTGGVIRFATRQRSARSTEVTVDTTHSRAMLVVGGRS